VTREVPPLALVTGASGYIGSHLCEYLLDRGWSVHAILRAGSTLSLPRMDRVSTYVDDGSPLDRLIGEARPDVCFHLAGYFVAQHGADDVERLLADNVLFGTRLVDAIARSSAPCSFINTGSFWQNVGGRQYAPAGLYAATKQAFQDVLQYYASGGGLAVTTLKLFDVYGPRDPRKKLLSLLIDAAKSGLELATTEGNQLLDLVFIDDVVRAFFLAFENNGVKGANTYSVSSGHPVSVRNLVRIVERVTGRSIRIRWGEVPYRKHEMFEPWNADPAMPGWEPNVSLEQGIKMVWAQALGRGS
jgi:nucleoside-diphosphate-sugar epimerase